MYTQPVCCTCLKNIANLRCIKNFDTDNISFLDKLRICINSDLEFSDASSLQICRSCIVNLNMFLKFREKALYCLNTLKCEEKDCNALDEYSSEIDIKIEDFHVEYEEIVDDNNITLIVKKEVIDYSLESGDQKINLESDNILNTVADKDSTNKLAKEYKSSPRRNTQTKSKQHIKNSYCCMYCEKKYTTATNLKEHITTHTNEKKYICNYCEKAFNRQSSYNRHLKTHLKPPGQKSKRTPFLCTICGKSFPFSNAAARHRRFHLGIKRQECQICHKKFDQSTHLNVHMRTHSGERPYICEKCGASFPLKASLDKHRKSKHKESENI